VHIPNRRYRLAIVGAGEVAAALTLSMIPDRVPATMATDASVHQTALPELQPAHASA
jgi:hypothetical protein